MNPDVVPLNEKDQTSTLERADKKPPIPAKPEHLIQQQQAISGILKGGKLWKSEHSSSQVSWFFVSNRIGFLRIIEGNFEEFFMHTISWPYLSVTNRDRNRKVFYVG